MKPQCLDCKSDIVKMISYVTQCIYDEQLEGFKLQSVSNEDVWFKCVKCQAEYNANEVMRMIKHD
jgi:hypothetical protein